MVLRLNWLEVCDDRAKFLKKHPPTTILNVPRFCYTRSAKGKWATDQCPTNLYCWDKSNTSKLTEIISLSKSEIPLFYGNPDEAPASELVEAEIARIRKVADLSKQLHSVEYWQKQGWEAKQ